MEAPERSFTGGAHFTPYGLPDMDGVASCEQLLKRLGQRLPSGRLAHPNGVAAKGRNDFRREDRARRRALQEAEIRVPVAAEHAALLIRLLEDANDFGFSVAAGATRCEQPPTLIDSLAAL